MVLLEISLNRQQMTALKPRLLEWMWHTSRLADGGEGAEDSERIPITDGAVGEQGKLS